jgi:hypothetical protein
MTGGAQAGDARHPRRVGAWLAALLTLLASGGCGLVRSTERTLPVPHQRAPAAAFDGVQRLCMLPFQNAEGTRGDTERVEQAFARELAKLHRFQVLTLPTGAPEGSLIHEAVARRQAATGPLAELVTRYGFDAVVLGTVLADRPYPPIHLAVQLRMVSLIDGSTLWSADAIYDSDDARVQEDLRNYADTFQSEEPTMHEWRMNLLSPERYSAYVAHRVCATLRD